MKNNNGISVKAECASITGELMEKNEDNFCFDGRCMQESHDDLEKNLTAEVGGQWVAVFDGIGGLPKGEAASYLAAKTLLEEERLWTEQDEQNYEIILLQMLKKIGDNITSWRKDRKITKMGTTMSALKFGQEAIYGLSIGDSRIYRMHNGELEQLSSDHTFRRPGHMKSALTEYLGKEHPAEFPENSFFCMPYEKGDRYLICSDGLTDMLEESKIQSLMEQPIEEAVKSLIAETIRLGADDNTTIILAEVQSEPGEIQNGPDAVQSESDAAMGKQIEYIQDGAEIISEEWIMQLQQEKYRSFGFEYKNWKNENLMRYRTDQDTNEKHYYSNFVGIVRWADKMLLSLPKSVKLDQSEGYLKKLEMLKVYAKLLDLYLADVWEAAEKDQKCKPKKAPWNMVTQSVEQWCAQTEKDQADTAEVQIIAAVKFEKVYEWLLGWLYGNQISLFGEKVFFESKILGQKEININECQNNVYSWKVYGKSGNGIQDRTPVFKNQEKKNIPDIVIEIDKEDPELKNVCCILDAKYCGWDGEAYILPGNADIYKQFFYQEQFVKLYLKRAPEKEVKIYNALIFPDYIGDTVRTNKNKEGILRLCAAVTFDLHKCRTIGIWQINLQKLIEGRISSDEEVQKQMQEDCRKILEYMMKNCEEFLPVIAKKNPYH